VGRTLPVVLEGLESQFASQLAEVILESFSVKRVFNACAEGLDVGDAPCGWVHDFNYVQCYYNMAFFTDAEGEWMVRSARAVLEAYLRHGSRIIPEPHSEKLARPFGVFTTLKTYPAGDLRGCIGYPEPIKPLNVALAETAILAATEDPRFPPVRSEELNRLVVEVSALTPPILLNVPKDDVPEHVEIGKHGLIIRYGPYSGLLLPQVPVEEGWDVDQFLAYTALKAGLPPDAWTWQDTKIYTFTAEVFSEVKPNGPVMRVM